MYIGPKEAFRLRLSRRHRRHHPRRLGTPAFDDEVVIVLAPSVSGSCPAIVFDGLTITDDRVFGQFEPGLLPPNTDGCDDDANPISFVFVVERRSLPDKFLLSVADEVICGGCDYAQINVDLKADAALEPLGTTCSYNYEPEAFVDRAANPADAVMRLMTSNRRGADSPLATTHHPRR